MEKKEIKCNPLDTNKLQPIKETEKAVCYHATFAVMRRKTREVGDGVTTELWSRDIWFPKVWIDNNGIIDEKHVYRKAYEQADKWFAQYNVTIKEVSWE